MEIKQPLIKQNEVEMYTESKESKYYRANIFQRITFWWIYPFVRMGNITILEQKMHDDLHPNHKSQFCYKHFIEKWEYFKDKSRLPILRSILSAFKKDIWFCFFIQMVCSTADIISPIIIKYVIAYVSDPDRTVGTGVGLFIIILCIKLVQAFFGTHNMFQFKLLGYNLTNSVSLGIFQKSLKVSLLSNKKYDKGKLVNMLQVDTNRLIGICDQLADLLFLPIQLVIGLFIMYNEIGVSFLIGFGVMLFMGLLNYLMGKYSVKLQKLLMKAKDKRVKVCTEIFSCIKFIKVNAYEELNDKREGELGIYKKKFILSIGQIITSWFTPVLVINATFALFVLTGNDITPSNSFVVISLFQVLQAPIQAVPNIITSLIETHISIKRIQDFYLTDEVDTKYIEQQQDKDKLSNEEYAVIMERGNFNWGKELTKDDDEDEDDKKSKKSKKSDSSKKYKKEEKKEHSIMSFTDAESMDEILDKSALVKKQAGDKILKHINLSIKKGQLVAIVGDVGCGKSSLIYSLIGEMKAQDNPKLKLNGKICLVNQKPWIMNLTVKENILFGLPDDPLKYKEAVQYSCLATDLEILSNGDQTMIGEKGVNLSGGQKTRIALARAIYSDNEILLLDDILSAVDIHVGLSIMKDCLMKQKANTTRILVTHSLFYMKYMDYIYLMDKGVIVEQGTYQQMNTSDKFQGIYKKFMKEHQEENIDEQLQLEDNQRKNDSAGINGSHLTLFKKTSSSHEDQLVKEKPILQDKTKYDNLILEEDRKKGQVEFSVFTQYLKINGGWKFGIPFIFVLFTQQALRVMSNIWMSIWANNGTSGNNNMYLTVYTLLSVGFVIFVALRAAILYYFAFQTARKVHKSMVACLIFAPLNEFFERVPLGRILNRFTKDIDVIDTMIHWGLSFLAMSIMNIINTSIMTMYASSPFLIFPIIIYLFICYRLQKFYQNAQREIIRLENITKSPVVSFFSEAINGLPSIRAYKQEERFFNQHAENVDENKKNQIATIAMSQWFRQILSLLSLMINMSSISICLFTTLSSPAQVGLLLAYAFQIDYNVRFLLTQFSQFENRLVSMERCIAYMELAMKVAGLKPHQVLQLGNWPQDGVIEFKSVYVRYRHNLDPALRGLTFIIQPQEKVGIVGRTGAGKSTVTLCLLRVLELFKGHILIDGFNIAKLSLQELRQKITIILQDPALFQGTLRENVDPIGLFQDDFILETMHKCNLKSLLDSRKGLDSEISDGGENLSVGEKQLICIARALLKKSKVVLIDEATANIDIETEHLIQKTLKEVFKDCTVLTIAHRINTIMSSDRILVMKEGRVEEFDKPKVLLQDPNSQFYQIYQSSKKEGNV